MPYRVKVKVMNLQTNADTGETTGRELKDMNFEVKAIDPRQAKVEAKKIFEEKYASDMLIKSCNFQARDRLLMYVRSKSKDIQANGYKNLVGALPRPARTR